MINNRFVRCLLGALVFVAPALGSLGYLPLSDSGLLLSSLAVLLVNLSVLKALKSRWLLVFGAFLKVIENLFAFLIWKTAGDFPLDFALSHLQVVKQLFAAVPFADSILFFLFVLGVSVVQVNLARALPAPRLSIAAVSLVFAVFLVENTEGRYLYYSGRHMFRAFDSPSETTATIPLSESIEFSGSDSLIILQLESLNSLVANGGLTLQGTPYHKPMAPVLLEAARDGMYFPQFYGNAVLTARAQEVILCGVSNNMGEAYSLRGGTVPFHCLPEIFRSNGFQTYYFPSYPRPFGGIIEFMKQIGFDLTLSKEIMKESDRELEWGYPDDLFYERVFDYLDTRPKGKRFVYIAVSALNHWPFDPRPEYQSVHEFPAPKNFYEKVANAVKQQDAALRVFLERFRRSNDGKTHLFILGDHSFPIGLHGNTHSYRNAYDDNFLTSMLYLPPTKPAVPAPIVNHRYDQVGMFHTILELFSGKPRPRSIDAITPNEQNRGVPEIWLNQPYGDKAVAVVRFPEKLIYSVKLQTLLKYDLERDPFEMAPEVVSSDMTDEGFSAYLQLRMVPPESQTNAFVLPVRVGEGKDEAGESIPAGMLPISEDFKYYFSLKALRDMDLVFTTEFVSFPHEILINGKKPGLKLCTGPGQEECRLRVRKEFLKEGRNTILIFNKPCIEDRLICGWRDDFIVNEISVEPPAGAAR